MSQRALSDRRWLAAAVLLAAGCAGPNAQIARCQAEKQELLSVIEQERARSKTLQERQLALESRLDESEKELARLSRPGATFGLEEPQVASRPERSGGAAGAKSTAPIREPARQPEPLPRKAPPSGSSAGEGKSMLREMKLTAPQRGASAEGRLAELAERDPRLEFDRQAGVARLRIDIPFDQSGAGLTAEGRKQLDEIAAWLKSSDTKDLRVLVAGHSSGMRRPPAGAKGPRYASDRELAAARAMAVADYLDRHGIGEDRLAIVGRGVRHPSPSAPPTTSVELLLSEPGSNMAGLWPETSRLR